MPSGLNNGSTQRYLFNPNVMNNLKLSPKEEKMKELKSCYPVSEYE